MALLALRRCYVGYKIQYKTIQDPSKNNPQINTPTCIDFGANLAPFWEGLESQLGVKIDANSIQNGVRTKTAKQVGIGNY